MFKELKEIKDKYDDDIISSREYQWRDKTYQKEPNGNTGIE